MLHRLIYASEAVRPLGPSAIDALLARARVANARRDITGALTFDSERFLQVLEGSGEQLSELYSRLVRDERHHRLRLIEFRPLDERAFDRWSMAYAAADPKTERVFRRFSGSGRLAPDELTAAAAVGILRELSATQPMMIAP